MVVSGRRNGVFAAVVSLWVAPLSAASFVSLKEVRHWTSNDVSRVAIETDAEVRYEYDRLPSPDRIYIDLINTRPSDGRKYRTIAVGEGSLNQIRIALKTTTVTRVVLDLSGDVEYSVSQLAVPDRVVIELRAKGAAPQTAAPDVSPPSAAESAISRQPAVAARPFRAPALHPMPVTSRPVEIFRAQDIPKLKAALAILPGAPESLMADVSTIPSRTARRTTLPPPEPSAASDPSTIKSLTRILGLKLNRVVLDPGHGGNDHGTTSPTGVVEKALVLDVTMRLGRLLEEQLGAQVTYTRKDDRFLSLDARTELANRSQADLFLSIHANSSPYKNVLGTETYYLNLTTVRADLDVAQRENAGSEKSVHELTDLVAKIAHNDKVVESRDFAQKIQGATHELVTRTHGRTYNRGVKKAPFVVLIGAKMPAVLVEIGFLTSPKEEAAMKTQEYRQRLAEALFKGVAQYAESLNRVRLARNTN
jgi:N-acetylmuramoyl-L-alanine amidase